MGSGRGEYFGRSLVRSLVEEEEENVVVVLGMG